MAFIPVPDTAEAVFEYTTPNANTVVNILYFLRDLGWTAGDLADLLDQLLIWWTGNLKTYMSNQYTLQRIKARDLTVQNGEYAELVVGGTPGQGGTASPAMPANVTIAVKFGTPFVGRSFRGRVYHPGLWEAAVSGDFITPGTGIALTNAYVNLNGVESNTESLHVVVSRYANNAPRLFGLATPVTVYSLNDLRVDTQRRRLIGEGG